MKMLPPPRRDARATNGQRARLILSLVCLSATSSFASANTIQMHRLASVMQSAQKLSVFERVKSVNTFWNGAIKEASDQAVWGREDYWATPEESLAKGAGDCEDYAIGKYFTLIKLGVPARDMKLAYVSAQIYGQAPVAHMVLVYYRQQDGMRTPYVLDNLSRWVLPASERTDLTVRFTFDQQGIYVNGQRRAGASTLVAWNKVLRAETTKSTSSEPGAAQPKPFGQMPATAMVSPRPRPKI